METFTITKGSITADGTLEVAFSVDGKKQKLSGMPVNDPEALVARLSEYGEAYARGLALTAPVAVAPEVKAMEAQVVPLVEPVVEVTPVE